LEGLISKAAGDIRKLRERHPNFEKTVKLYFDWRINTIVNIERRYATFKGPNPNVRPLAEKIERSLQSFPRSTTEEARDRFLPDLEKIIYSAISLDADMWRQKSFIHPAKPRFYAMDSKYTRKYNPDSMELWGGPPAGDIMTSSGGSFGDKTVDLNPEVTLVISPCLMKSGDSKGDHYEIFTTLIKSQVSCEPEFIHAYNGFGAVNPRYSQQTSYQAYHHTSISNASSISVSSAMKSTNRMSRYDPQVSSPGVFDSTLPGLQRNSSQRSRHGKSSYSSNTLVKPQVKPQSS
jgi:hypothetical protein